MVFGRWLSDLIGSTVFFFQADLPGESTDFGLEA